MTARLTPRRLSRCHGLAHFLVVALTLASLALTSSLFAARDTQTLEIYWVDVEGGAATLIVTPAGESILIDSGNPGTRDAGRIHDVATNVAGLEHIDYLITTHFHLDHFGGAAQLSTLMPIKVVYDNGIPDKNPDNRPNDTRFPLLIKPYRDMKVHERRLIRPGMTLPLVSSPNSPPLRLTCLATKRDVRDLPNAQATQPYCENLPNQKPYDNSDNANSVVVLLELGDFRFFDAGDLTWNIEPTLVCPANIVGSEIDVYQVTHHGLDRSNNPALLQALAPTVTVMNNGVTKGCGPETFKTLHSLDSAAAHYQVHKNLREDREHNTDENQIANLERNCEGHHIRLSVAADATSYTVSVPSRDHQRTFQTKTK